MIAKPASSLGGEGALRVLFLTHYARIGGPSRYRFYQYFPRLRQAGIEPTVQVIQTEHMYRMKEQRGRSVLFLVLVAMAYVKRMLFLVALGKHFRVWVVEKELFPVLPYWIERMFFSASAKVIVDYDDAVFLKYDNRSGVPFLLCRGKIGRLMQRADVVLAGNPFIADYARRAGATDIRRVPSVIDETRYTLRRETEAESVPVIGWIGSYRNSRHIVGIAGALRRLAAAERFVLRIVGGGVISLPREVKVEYRAWSEETELEELRRFSIGIMPLEAGEWERGKCGLKLIQYLAVGLPVVATPIGVNSEIVVPGVNGYLASTEDEWYEALRRTLRESREGRFSPAQCASTVSGVFTIKSQAAGLISVIRALATDANGSHFPGDERRESRATPPNGALRS